MSKNDEGIDIPNFDKGMEIGKFKGIRPVGWEILVRLYIAPVKNNGIYIPDTAQDDQQYKSCVGLVIDRAKGVYQDERYNNTGAWCEVGDWIVFPRQGGAKIYVDGLPCYFLPEDAMYAVTDDPRRITR
jgi:co-chaperonin GroES (HSP10)